MLSSQHQATEINKLFSSSDTDEQYNPPETIISNNDIKQRSPVTSELDSQATLLPLSSTDKRERY